MFANNTVTVGSGKSIHWGSDCGTACGAAHRNGFFTAPKTVKADTATCKRCIKIMAVTVENDHELALIDNRSHDAAEAVASSDIQHDTQWIDADGVVVQVTRVAAAPFPRVQFRKADGSTGALSLVPFAERFTALLGKEEAHSEALRTANDLDRSAKLVALLTGPEVLATVPDTAEAWQAYAARVKASRDVAEAELGRLLHGVLKLADEWEHAADNGRVIHRPWSGLRVLAAGVGR